MAVELEKKFRLTPEQFGELELKLNAMGAVSKGTRFERNILFSNAETDRAGGFLRLREMDHSAELTLKQPLKSENGMKRQLEYETAVSSYEETEKIIEHIGLKKRLIYEKRRSIWEYITAEVVLDELPFGLFVEIEGTSEQILFIERALGLDELPPELKTYPALTAEFGVKEAETTVARF